MAEAITGRIYRIISDSHPECLPYYGSTIRTLKKRWSMHKSPGNKTCSKQLMGFDDVRMELLEELVCDSIRTLHTREQWYIDNNECCNKQNAVCDKKEYMKTYNKAHQEQKKEYMKTYNETRLEQKRQWNEANRERINELRRIRRANRLK
jgi:hypothetical protein